MDKNRQRHCRHLQFNIFIDQTKVSSTLMPMELVLDGFEEVIRAAAYQGTCG